MSRDSYRIDEGDKLWPLIQIIRKTHYDDLTADRVQQLIKMVDSWRATDADGKLIRRGLSLSQAQVGGDQ